MVYNRISTMHAPTELLHDSPIAIKNAGVHQANVGEDYPFHRDDFWELMYVRQGHIVCQQESTRYSLHSGMGILHPARALHADFATSAYQTYYIWLDLPWDSFADTWPHICYDDEMHRLERICSEIVWEWNRRYKWNYRYKKADTIDRTDPTSDQMLRLLSEQLAIMIERCAETSDRSASEQLLDAAEQIMEREYHQPLTVAEIAKRLHTSQSNLYSHFAAQRGKTPMEVLQAIRLRHALVHLHHSTRTLDTIASLCGYCSASHLTKHVRTATGSTPGRLRAKAKESEASEEEIGE